VLFRVVNDDTVRILVIRHHRRNPTFGLTGVNCMRRRLQYEALVFRISVAHRCQRCRVIKR
jgi:hypothetical protein